MSAKEGFTAHAIKNGEEMIHTAGCNKYFTKPIVDFDLFRQEINKSLIDGRANNLKSIV